MKIIVNADDMGYTKSISEGIIEGYKQGIVSSTTVMCHMPYAAAVPALIADCPQLGVGVHLTLTCGRPLTDCPDLTDEDGSFYKYRTFFQKKADRQQVYREFKAQIEKFIAIFGRRPTHIDSHQGCHDGITVLLKNNPHFADAHNTEEIYQLSLKLAAEYDLPLRRSCHYKWTDAFYGAAASVETIEKTMEDSAGQDREFMVHPGYCDLELYRKSSYNTDRVKELAALCDPRIKEYLIANGIDLVNFAGVKKDITGC